MKARAPRSRFFSESRTEKYRFKKLQLVFGKLFLNFKQKVTYLTVASVKALPPAGKEGGFRVETVVSQKTSNQTDLEHFWFGFQLE